MTERIDDRSEKDDENKLEKIEEISRRYGKKANEYICNVILGEAIQEAYHAGKRDGANETALVNKMTNDQEWLRKQIEEAQSTGYKRGFKEGQKAALKSLEGSNKKIYEG